MNVSDASSRPMDEDDRFKRDLVLPLLVKYIPRTISLSRVRPTPNQEQGEPEKLVGVNERREYRVSFFCLFCYLFLHRFRRGGQLVDLIVAPHTALVIEEGGGAEEHRMEGGRNRERNSRGGKE